MTIANNVVAKLSVAFVTVAMLFTFVAPTQAATEEELQKMVNDLLAQIAALKGTTTVSGSAYVFTRPLTIGSQGADVTALQTYLIGKGFAIPAGATGYFGTQTQSAVAAWQAANGVMPAAGYFGPVSQAKYTALVGAGTGTGTGTGTGSDNDDLEGEASLGDTDLQDGEDTDIEEGQEAAPVAELEVEFDDGDALVSRIDISLVDTGTEEDPWDTFEEVSIWVDGDEIASKDISDEDEYLDEDDGTIRIGDLDLVVREGEKTTLVIAVTVQGSVDDIPATWNVDVDSIRYEDADGAISTDDVSVDSVDFDIEEEGEGDELAVKTSAEDPDATTLQLQDDERSDWITVFAFDLDTDDSDNDIEINSIPVHVVLGGGATAADVINDLSLVIDGEEFDDWSYATGTSASSTFDVVFDIDGDLVIDAGDRVTAELQVEFKALTSGFEGDTIIGSITHADEIDAEGADDLGASQLSGSATGEVHTLRTAGVVLEFVSASDSLVVNDDASTTDNEGLFVIKFDVTAFDEDIFFEKTTDRSTTTSNQAVNFIIEDNTGAEVASAGTAVAVLSSTAETDNGYFRVDEGETETFTLTVEYDPATAGFYQVQLYSVNFADAAEAPETSQRALPESDYETDPRSI